VQTACCVHCVHSNQVVLSKRILLKLRSFCYLCTGVPCFVVIVLRCKESVHWDGAPEGTHLALPGDPTHQWWYMMILHHDSNAFKIFQASLTSSFNKELSKSTYIWDLHWAMLSSLAPMPSQAGHGCTDTERGELSWLWCHRQRYAKIC